MTSTSWENNQLRPYLDEFRVVPPSSTRGNVIPGSSNRLGYPIVTNAKSSYGAMSIAPNKKGKKAADTTSGNRVFDAGFGAFQ